MHLPYFQINAFTRETFGGNPAGVCPMEQWLPDTVMQRLAAEHRLSETAFYLQQAEGTYHLRWFSPTMEIDLCGHATLATAHVLWRHAAEQAGEIIFHTRSGPLHVRQEEGRIAMNFPALPATPGEMPADAAEAFACQPLSCARARDLVFMFEDEEQIRNLRPDQARLAAWETFGIIATAPGKDVDFVSRFFAPRVGIPEDPVTGSAHCTLIPYWAGRLNKHVLTARQLSARGGDIFCEALGDRVKIAGEARTYLKGVIEF